MSTTVALGSLKEQLFGTTLEYWPTLLASPGLSSRPQSQFAPSDILYIRVELDDRSRFTVRSIPMPKLAPRIPLFPSHATDSEPPDSAVLFHRGEETVPQLPWVAPIQGGRGTTTVRLDPV
ncbi:hypothetical protein SCALM49S_08813 [Streptomyces californicus]